MAQTGGTFEPVNAEKDAVGSLIRARTGARGGRRMTTYPSQKRTPNPPQLNPNPMMCFTCFDVTSSWLMLCCSIAAQEKQKIGSWVLKEKSRPFPKCFFSCRFFFLVLSIYFFFPSVCWKKQILLWKSCLWRKFLLVCAEKLDKREAFFLPNKCILFSLDKSPFLPSWIRIGNLVFVLFKK